MRHECKYGCNPYTFKILGDDGFYDCPEHGGIGKKVEDYAKMLENGEQMRALNIPEEYLIAKEEYCGVGGIANVLEKYTGLSIESKIVEMLDKSACRYTVDVVCGLDMSVYKWVYTLMQIAVLEGKTVVPLKTLGWLSEVKQGDYRGYRYLDYVTADLCVIQLNSVLNKTTCGVLYDFLRDRAFECKGVILLNDMGAEELQRNRWCDFLAEEPVNYITVGKDKPSIKGAVKSKKDTLAVLQKMFKVENNDELGFLE